MTDLGLGPDSGLECGVGPALATSSSVGLAGGSTPLDEQVRNIAAIVCLQGTEDAVAPAVTGPLSALVHSIAAKKQQRPSYIALWQRGL